jgi:GWxTD domain-containing protein
MMAWETVGLALVHFLWQGMLLGLLVWVAARWIGAPRLRHGIAVAALLLMLGSFVMTLLVSIPTATMRDGQAAMVPSRVPDRALAVGSFQKDWAEVLPWLSGAWICGVLVLAGSRAGGWWMTRRLRRQGVCLPGNEWRTRMDALQARMGLSAPVAWLESSLVHTPMVLGWLRPVLLTPVGMLTSMPVSQVESILLHELAHLYRRDPLVNLLQAVVETLLFYHPAVWWVSRMVRLEREKCCDDLVVAMQGDAKEYARALLVLEEQRCERLEPALAANGGELMQRIERLAGKKEEARGLGGALTLVCLVTLLGCLVAFGQQQTVYDQWLKKDVVYIIKDDEKQTFVKLKTDEEREKFIEQFWSRRDPSPATPNENEFKKEHYRRIAYASERFATKIEGWKTDQGRMYITFGPPDEMEMHPGERANWLYRQIPGVGERVMMEFKFVGGEYVMTMDPNAKGDAKKFKK